MEIVKHCLDLPLLTKAIGWHATVWRIWVPPEADSKKQGKLGPDVGAPRAALYLFVYAQAREARRRLKIAVTIKPPEEIPALVRAE